MEPRHTPAGKGRVAERSGPPSSAGTGGPVSADSLQAELRELYRPDQEPVSVLNQGFWRSSACRRGVSRGLGETHLQGYDPL